MTDPWDDYRVRRNVALVAYAGFFPMVFGFVPAVCWAAGVALEAAAAVSALVWFGFVAVADTWRSTFPCPRCGWMFFRGLKPMTPEPLTQRCRHCGLPKWADPAEYDEGEPS